MNRFIDNGDGTITDATTYLMWTKDANLAKIGMTWGSASKYTNSLTFGGFSDWRLPTIKELLSLIDYSQYNPALQVGHPFINVRSNYYWSSTSFAGNPNDAWVVIMWNGYVGNYNKSDSYYNYVWPVRSLLGDVK